MFKYSSVFSIKESRVPLRLEKLLFPDLMEKTLINHIRNFTETGFKSSLFETFMRQIPYDKEMGRTEVEDYT